MEKGYLSLVLHAHLPFVRHPEYDYFLEENWFYEAVVETYIPFIKVFNKLLYDGVDFRITMSLTPPLIEMLNDDLLRDRCLRYINNLIELSELEISRTKNEPVFNRLATMYHERFIETRHIFVEEYGKDLISAFKRLQDLEKLEIITCASTHAFLPVIEINKQALRSQILIAVEHYKEVFGRKPSGIWLPECGYYPGIDEILKDAGIRYFILDAHGILYAKPRPRYGVFAPIYCPSGVAAFGRDVESSKQVWSSKEGYPGDFNYREFYRDIGFDLDFEYIRPYIHPDGIRIHTGIKYYRITGRTDHKEPYIKEIAIDKASEHAGNFMFNRERQVEYLFDLFRKKPVIVAPYDAELFGHWWFEGPEWLDFLIRKIYYDQDTIRLITPMEYLRENPLNQIAVPNMSSWGYKGYSEVWLEGSNDWIYRHIHRASERMVELAEKFPLAEGILQRALNQAVRELLLAQSSDWAFIMKTGTAVEYAMKRTKEHLRNFNRLYTEISNNNIDTHFLSDLEIKNNVFRNVNHRVYGRYLSHSSKDL